MRSTIGVVFLAREILAKKDITQHPKRLSIVIHLMAWVQYHSNETIYWRGEPRQLMVGEVLTTLRELELETKIEYQSVNRILKYLEKRNTIIQEVTQHGRLIKLVNFGLYQDFEKVSEKQISKKRKTDEKRVKNQRKTRDTIQSSNPVIQLSSDRIPSSRIDVKEIIDFWNAECGRMSFEDYSKMPSTMIQKIHTLIDLDGLDNFRELIKKASRYKGSNLNLGFLVSSESLRYNISQEPKQISFMDNLGFK